MLVSEPIPAKTPVGILGTLGAWHRRASAYGLQEVEAIVRAWAPDLLCAEINQADWEAGRVAALPVEYRECLLPVCRELGVVLVPVGDHWHAPPSPLRLALPLGAGPRWINSAEADRCHCLWAHLWPGSQRANRELVENILQAVRRDPGRRVLVIVRVERRYAVVQRLCQTDEVRLVPV
jgi:hypothetical protein